MLKKELAEIRDNKICELYNKYYLVGEIAAIVSADRHTVTRVLKKKGLYQAERNKTKISSAKAKRNEKIIQLYQKGLSFRQIEKKMGVGHSTAERVIHQYIDLTLPQYSLNIDDRDNLIRKYKYDFDREFFKKIDSEEKAYWLGFLYADGTIVDDAVKLALQASDLDHLLEFRNTLKNDTKEPIYRNKPESYSLYFNSKEMVQDLENLGCFQRKTFRLSFPTASQVPHNLVHHFMRGYFDGDGCIYVNPKTTGTNMMVIIGTENFVDGYKSVLFDAINKNSDIKYRRHRKNIVSMFLGGNIQLSKVYNFLYKDATVFLKRKKEKFNIILGRLKTSSQKSLGDKNGIKLENRKAS